MGKCPSPDRLVRLLTVLANSINNPGSQSGRGRERKAAASPLVSVALAARPRDPASDGLSGFSCFSLLSRSPLQLSPSLHPHRHQVGSHQQDSTPVRDRLWSDSRITIKV
ncbi:hypothetical protein AGOR_G00215980 [Albula goreensis]|uniref:Uncharacterized protein n=1 Tax=Albula goreensis TaxID=1534307 RepID=A0A8T3CMH1_9TELE|nr:hypothetical protein AGOR_G00215980 [Albula goreensis]